MRLPDRRHEPNSTGCFRCVRLFRRFASGSAQRRDFHLVIVKWRGRCSPPRFEQLDEEYWTRTPSKVGGHSRRTRENFRQKGTVRYISRSADSSVT